MANKPFFRRRKVCPFSGDNAPAIDYKDTNLLRKFISDRGKIRARRVTGNCTQHQRDIAVLHQAQIARHQARLAV